MKQHLSYSQLSTLSCLKRYYYSYILNLKPKRFNQALDFGKYFHQGMDILNTTGDIDSAVVMVREDMNKINAFSMNDEDVLKLEWMKIVVIAMIEGYYKYFYITDRENGIKILDSEQEYMVPIRNPKNNYMNRKYEYNFILDMIYENKKGELWLVEYKTASRLGQSYFERLLIDGQGRGMAYMLKKEFNKEITGISYRIMKKPSIRQKKGESVSEFHERLGSVFQDQAEDYFIEKKVYFDQTDLLIWAKDLWDSTKIVQFIKKNDCFPRDTSKCTILNCPFVALCSSQQDAELLYEQKDKR